MSKLKATWDGNERRLTAERDKAVDAARSVNGHYGPSRASPIVTLLLCRLFLSHIQGF